MNDHQASASLLQLCGDIARVQGDLTQAVACTEESLAMYRALDDQRGTARALRALGELALEQGAVQRASDAFVEGLRLARLVGDQGNIAWLLYHTGRLAFGQRDMADAVTRFVENAQLCDRLGYREGIALSLASLAAVAIERREPVQAARFLGAAEAQWEPSSWLQSTARADYHRTLHAVRTLLDDAAFAAAWAEGRKMTLEQAVDEALALE
jgi:hypothetical protein